MARARNIKPNFFKNELLGVCDPLVNLLFISLWTLADKAGRLEDRPLRIKAETFPYRENLDVNGYLTELASLEFICRYETECGKYIQIINFDKHQSPHKTEKESTIPSMEKALIKSMGCDLTVKQPLNNDGLTAALPPDSLIPDSLIPDSLIPDSKPLSPSARVSKQDDSIFEEAWAAYPKRPNNSKAAAMKAWNARVKNGADTADMILGVKRYAKYCEVMRTEPNFIKQASTFFGPDQHYLNEFDAKPSTGKAGMSPAVSERFRTDYDRTEAVALEIKRLEESGIDLSKITDEDLIF